MRQANGSALFDFGPSNPKTFGAAPIQQLQR
jgi:hypothetical protein